MQPNPKRLIDIIGIQFPLIGFYDTPEPAAFEPLVSPESGRHICVFAFFDHWLKGKTLHVTRDSYGCGGAGRYWCGVEPRSREEMITFLVDTEGLRSSREIMGKWLDEGGHYGMLYDHLCIGPLRSERYHELKTVTFYINPDQLGMFMLGAYYHHAPGDPDPVSAPFGSGCMQVVPGTEKADYPRAVVGATDIAMRQFLPPDILAFTVNKPMFKQLCDLDERSFLYKPFWKTLTKARKSHG
ncbi:DUF169 domain-containing protein [bacterium]|nr:DUF169 domain-containing protein [candidate division CSSED10-310 bacterium]